MRIYFMGVCGTAMGNAALLMRALGHEVTGSDVGAYPPMSDHLRSAGVEILEGWDAARLERLAPDLVVVGTSGKSALRRLWVGSVASAVARHAEVSVMLVRERRGEDADGDQ